MLTSSRLNELQLNNEYHIQSILNLKSTNSSKRQFTIPSNLILPKALPSFSKIESIAISSSYQARKDQVLKLALETALHFDALPSNSSTNKKSKSTTSVSKVVVAAGSNNNKSNGWKGLNKGSPLEGWQVFKAVEEKDIMFLMEVRDREFDLLVQPQRGSNTTPLVSAMKLGKSHREIAILLTGAISRQVNNLTDEELTSSKTKSTLRAIRTNLKSAISYGLESSQTDLIASYLQIGIMSEGTPWLLSAIQTISLAIRGAGVNSGERKMIVENAETIFSKYVQKELKIAQASASIAAVGDYVSNAVADLVLMALWSNATDNVVNSENLPLWYFARDDKITKALLEGVEELKSIGEYTKLSKSLRKQIEISLEIMLKRSLGAREKLEELKLALDK